MLLLFLLMLKWLFCDNILTAWRSLDENLVTNFWLIRVHFGTYGKINFTSFLGGILDEHFGGQVTQVLTTW